MEYVKFSLVFIMVHVVSYTIAGVIALKFSKDIYESKKRHCDFLRDMSEQEENKRVSILFIPAQLLRGLLMSIVLFPLLNTLIEFNFISKFIFFVGLMFIYTHIAAVSPFIDNIEGFVYFKKAYFKKEYFLKFQIEMIIYCIIFGLLISIFI